MKIYASTKMDISNYLDWFMKRLRDGFFDKEINEKTINRYLLKDIDEIILYTRTPSKIYKNRDIFSEYNTKLITFVSMYDQFFEPRIKEKDKILNTIRKCKNYYENYFGYGPIFYTNNHNKQWHLSQFELLCDSLHRFVKGVYIDFDVNEYCRKSHKLNVYQLSKSEQDELLKELKTIADKYGLQIFFMKKESDFDEDEIDVGLPNCCPYACEYCPSVNNRKSAKDKYEIFDSNNTLLYGIMSQKQKIVEVDLSKIEQEEKQEIYEQSSLLDFI